jgi:hypothetical protein
MTVGTEKLTARSGFAGDISIASLEGSGTLVGRGIGDGEGSRDITGGLDGNGECDFGVLEATGLGVVVNNGGAAAVVGFGVGFDDVDAIGCCWVCC